MIYDVEVCKHFSPVFTLNGKSLLGSIGDSGFVKSSLYCLAKPVTFAVGNIIIFTLVSISCN